MTQPETPCEEPTKLGADEESEAATQAATDAITDRDEERDDVFLIDDAVSAYLPFNAYEEALETLREVGYAHTEQAPAFTSSALTEAVNELIGGDGVLLMDMTPALPETPQAAYQALSVAAFNAEVATRKDANAAFLIMRTQGNTPSFLFGHHWNLVQSLGKDVALQHVRSQPTPAAFVMFRERQIFIPSSICTVDETLAARLLAAEITAEPKHFCCEICGEGLVTHDSSGNIIKIEEVAVAPDKRLFKRSCAEAHNARILSEDFVSSVTLND